MFKEVSIPGSTGYTINTNGEVFRNGKMLLCNPSNEYKQVVIWFEDKTKKRWYVHRLIATMFIKNPDNLPQVNHIDCNKHNNEVSNLEWVTAKQNNIHAADNGLTTCENGATAKLTNTQVHHICQLLQNGKRVTDITGIYGTSQSTISQIKSGVQWKDISCQYKYPDKKRTLSDDTVKWICRMLSDGKRHKEIISTTTNPRVRVGVIDSILHRLAYKDISKDFVF